MLAIITNPVRLTRNLEPLVRAIRLDPVGRNKDNALYTYLMIHVYLAQKKNCPFKICPVCLYESLCPGFSYLKNHIQFSLGTKAEPPCSREAVTAPTEETTGADMGADQSVGI